MHHHICRSQLWQHKPMHDMSKFLANQITGHRKRHKAFVYSRLDRYNFLHENKNSEIVSFGPRSTFSLPSRNTVHIAHGQPDS